MQSNSRDPLCYRMMFSHRASFRTACFLTSPHFFFFYKAFDQNRAAQWLHMDLQLFQDENNAVDLHTVCMIVKFCVFRCVLWNHLCLVSGRSP